MTIAELSQVLSEDVIVDVVLEADGHQFYSGEIGELCRYYYILSEMEISSIIGIETSGYQLGHPHIVIPIEPDEDELEAIREEIEIENDY